jgi:hypothetical protein
MLLEALPACTTTYLSRKEDKYLIAFLSLNSDNDNKSALKIFGIDIKISK